MITSLIVLQILILLITFYEFFLLKKNRIIFEELILKFVETVQIQCNNYDAHIKKISDSSMILTKTINSLGSLKESSSAIEGSVKELQTASKFIKTSTQKEFKSIEDSIKKLKSQLK